MPSTSLRRTVLVLGATGTTGSRVARRLAEAGHTVRAASRSPQPDADPELTPVLFDWSDPLTHQAALEDAEAVYLLPPTDGTEPAGPMLDLIATARSMGVGRLVLGSARVYEPGQPGVGEVHAGLAAGPPGWAVLRPTWFAQNFLTPGHHTAEAIAQSGEFVNAAGKGRVPFIDAEDIAAVAVEALTAAESLDADVMLTGPEAITYGEAARIVGEALGKPVTARAVSEEESKRSMVAAGLPEGIASFLAAAEARIATGAEDVVTDEVKRITGHAPRGLADALSEELGREALRGPGEPL